MADITNNFEGGVNNADIVSDLAVGGGTAFDSAVAPVGSTMKYTTSAPYEGSVAAKMRVGTTAGALGCIWNTALGTPINDYYMRFFFKSDVTPPGNSSAVIVTLGRASDGQMMGGIGHEWTGKLEIFDINFGISAVMANPLVAGQWYRVEAFVHGAATATGYIIARVYADPLSNTITETLDGSVAPWAFDAAPATGRVIWGATSAGTDYPTANASEFVYFDRVSIGRTSGWYGPVVYPSWQVPSPPFW